MRLDSLSRFLLVTLLLIAGIVVVGGITRLTGSGLSITEWKPIMGTIPPLTEAHWNEAFDKYKQIPQYKVLNSSMTLGEFKWIFFWEYIHRLLARAIGLVFGVGILWNWRRVDAHWRRRLVVGFLLGGLQGVVGWIMVASGLEDLVYVSHYRLALHLLLALFVFSYLLWLFLNRVLGEAQVSVALRRPVLRLWTWLLVLQILYGAFVAGLKAGLRYNEFPLMGGSLFPPDGFLLEPALLNWIANPSTVQFVHRMLAWSLLVWAVVVFVRLQRARESKWILHPTLLQFGLGVMTILLATPVWAGAVHQFGAVVLLTGTVAALHAFARRNSPACHEGESR